MEDFYITIEDSGNHLEDFAKFMAATTESLNLDAHNRADYFRSMGGEKLESVVIEAMQAWAAPYRFNPDLIRHTDKQHFPDIVSNKYFGVEVKSTQSNHWKSIGSSIVESLREPFVKKVFLMFGKLPANADCAFKCKPYEECLYDISITHSPRYQIDMETPRGKTIFDKLGEDYDVFRKDPNQIKVMRNYYRQYYTEKGSMPWWIEDIGEQESSDPVKSYLKDTNGAKFWDDIEDPAVKTFLRESMYQLFPELLKNKCPSKYKNASLWLCSRYSIINPSFRDIFSAAGQGKIVIDETEVIEKVPKALCTFLQYYKEILDSFDRSGLSYSEIPIYASYYTPDCDPKEVWLKKIKEYWNGNTNVPIRFEDVEQLKFVGARNDVVDPITQRRALTVLMKSI